MPTALAVTDAGFSGYDRRSQYLYIPIGASMDLKWRDWGFRPTAEFDYFVHGWQESYLRDVGYDNNLGNDQSAGYGLRGSIMFAPPVDFHNFSFGPYVRYWNIHNSDPS